MAPQKNYYKILEVSPNASIEVITAAWRALSKKLGSKEDLQKTLSEVRQQAFNRKATNMKAIGH